MSEKMSITCPLCAKSHEYLMDIKTSTVMCYMLTVDSGEKKFQTFTRVFNCPKLKERFQAAFSIEIGFNEIIDEVKVLGICDDSENSSN